MVDRSADVFRLWVRPCAGFPPERWVTVINSAFGAANLGGRNHGLYCFTNHPCTRVFPPRVSGDTGRFCESGREEGASREVGRTRASVWRVGWARENPRARFARAAFRARVREKPSSRASRASRGSRARARERESSARPRNFPHTNFGQVPRR